VNVLVCDDDKATRFVVKRILTQNFGLTVTECGDGLEALQALSKGRFHFMLIDVEMPNMSGIEVLELLRESEATKSLPVIVLSHVRDGEAIQHLVKLGVSDYILKPPRTDKLVTKIQRLLKVLPKSQELTVDGSGTRLSSKSAALIVDGSLDFRFAMNTELQRYGPVQEADSGATAVARFRENPCPLVFIGQDLGVVGPDLLVRKLRQIRPDGPLRIVGVVSDMSTPPQGQFDAVIQRSFLPAMLRSSLGPFVEVPGPMNALRLMVPDFVELTVSATAQSFGMMFDAEVTAGEAQGNVEAVANATVEVDIAARLLVTVGVHLTLQSATDIAVRMFGTEPANLTDDDRISVAGEICNLVTGRITANLSERGMQSDCSLPAMSGTMTVTAPDETQGCLALLSMAGSGNLVLSINVVDRTADAGPRSAEDPEPVVSV
jgi:two-component system, chemotaxis family, chemotaxis protein CheY